MKTYLRHKISNVVDVKELIALEYLDFEGKYKNYVEKHDFWEICCVRKGSITLTTDQVSHTLAENQLVVIPPQQLHSYSSAAGNESKAFVICFESVSHALKPLSGACFLLDGSQQACIRTIIEETTDTFHMDENDHLAVRDAPNFGGQQAIFLQLEYLLICLLRQYSEQRSSGIVFLSGEKFYSDLAEIVIQYFRDHIREKLSLSIICEKFNYSRSFLCKNFKMQTGETLIACFNRLKIEEAQRLLDRTALSAAEISGLLGFSEPKYFGALFKKYIGLSPIAYRERKNVREEK